jgi:hypothetical protein
MEQPEQPLPDNQWNLKENDYVGMTEYRYKDLPTWAKQQLTLPEKNKNKIQI